METWIANLCDQYAKKGASSAYVETGNATQATAVAGYSARTAYSQGNRLLVFNFSIRIAPIARLISSWDVDLILTTGDNNFSVNDIADDIDMNIGRIYHSYIGNYQGSYGR